MTTYTFSGISYTSDFETMYTYNAQSEFQVIAPDLTTSFSYSIIEEPYGNLPSVRFENFTLFDAFLDGISLRDSLFTLSGAPGIGTINWGGNKSSTVLVIFDFFGDSSHTEGIILLDGDPFPVMETLSEANTFFDSITSIEPVTSGPFAPGVVIDVAALPLIATTEDDTIFGDETGNAYDGGLGNDQIDGNGGDDALSGGIGNDALLGGDGNDTLNGDAGNDTLLGDAGNDIINGGDGRDSIKGGTGDDIMHGDDGNDYIRGQAGDDTIYGDLGNDYLVGHAGFDTIYGGDGRDTIKGHANDDLLYGGAGNDTIRGNANNDLLDGGDGDDRLIGHGGADHLIGGAGNDELKGGSGNDTLEGGDGDDRLIGMKGADMIAGGAGADTFVFIAAAALDTVSDYELGIDALEFDASYWTGIADAAALVDAYATVTAAGVEFDFGGGNILTLEGLASVDGLAADVVDLV